MNRTLTIYISQEQYNWLDNKAYQLDRSKSYIVQNLINYAISKEE